MTTKLDTIEKYITGAKKEKWSSCCRQLIKAIKEPINRTIYWLVVFLKFPGSEKSKVSNHIR
ncbi:MAG: hypothetical protein D6719_00835, partial [Candidatus Dadabacteria bacterium]